MEEVLTNIHQNFLMSYISIVCSHCVLMVLHVVMIGEGVSIESDEDCSVA